MILCIVIVLVLFIPILLISIGIKISSKGPIIYWSKRVGKNKIIFLMPKFRTMRDSAPQLSTANMKNHQNYVTHFGKVLRKFSLDEIPQLYSIFKGDMNFIGPRPALYNQYDLIKLRDENGINKFLPGITGWAQVNGRDELSIEKKVNYEYEYILKKSIIFDF
jgi:O-antigen biosynthesis protein WbqP